jgi:hypothetical protein
VEQLAVGAGADLVDDSWLQVQEDATRHVLAGAGLRKEGVEGIVATADGLVRRHLAIGLNTVLQAVELPAGIADLSKQKQPTGDGYWIDTRLQQTVQGTVHVDSQPILV